MATKRYLKVKASDRAYHVRNKPASIWFAYRKAACASWWRVAASPLIVAAATRSWWPEYLHERQVRTSKECSPWGYRGLLGFSWLAWLSRSAFVWGTVNDVSDSVVSCHSRLTTHHWCSAHSVDYGLRHLLEWLDSHHLVESLHLDGWSCFA